MHSDAALFGTRRGPWKRWRRRTLVASVMSRLIRRARAARTHVEPTAYQVINESLGRVVRGLAVSPIARSRSDVSFCRS
jgi:hypothetical protein